MAAKSAKQRTLQDHLTRLNLARVEGLKRRLEILLDADDASLQSLAAGFARFTAFATGGDTAGKPPSNQR